MNPTEFSLHCQFAASPAQQIDATKGIIPGVTVAEVGVATGHFCYLDRDGKVMGVGGVADAEEFKGAVKRLPLGMDEKSLQTIVAAIPANKKVKTREDHSDAIAARAGYAQAFRVEGGKCVCDLQVYDAYANRALFLETAAKSPEEIGLSGDFKFTVEVVAGMALMRVTRVDAVDIVDKGALTHAGLFKALPVDSTQSGNLTTMAKAQDGEPDFEGFKSLCDSLAAYSAKNKASLAKIQECMASLAGITPVAGVADPAGGTPGAAAAALAAKPEAVIADLSAKLTALETNLKAEVAKSVKAEVVELKKNFSALGLKAGETPAPGAEATKAEEAAALAAPAAAKPGEPKTFLELKASIAKERKLKGSDAAAAAMREKPALYQAHLKALGIFDPAKSTAAA